MPRIQPPFTPGNDGSEQMVVAEFGSLIDILRRMASSAAFKFQCHALDQMGVFSSEMWCHPYIGTCTWHNHSHRLGRYWFEFKLIIWQASSIAEKNANVTS